ncbi:MAG: hypothetical protein HFG43_00800 [Lachnospiraceae bacterium]|jgi:predicted HicB family RNase H-like nuclease|nr:hypothetical protein [Lachnospiraceae bacterium]
MSKSAKEDKIQTGLRIPEKQYERLTVFADRMGVSINALILMLVDIGLNQLECQIKE